MEKKVTKKFYLVSSVNILSAIILAGGDIKDSLALIGVLIVLVLNHIVLLKIVSGMTTSMAQTGADSKRALRNTILFMVLKMMLFAGVVAAIYFYKQDLTPKVLVLIIFQLIIQVVSIKNNY